MKQSKKGIFEVEKGEKFTSKDFKETFKDYFNDRELRALFTFVMKVWKADGDVVEVGKEENETVDGHGKPRTVYLAKAKLVFRISAEDINKRNT